LPGLLPPPRGADEKRSEELVDDRCAGGKVEVYLKEKLGGTPDGIEENLSSE